MERQTGDAADAAVADEQRVAGELVDPEQAAVSIRRVGDARLNVGDRKTMNGLVFAASCPGKMSPYVDVACTTVTFGVTVESVADVAIAERAPAFASVTVRLTVSPGSNTPSWLPPLSSIAVERYAGAGCGGQATASASQVAEGPIRLTRPVATSMVTKLWSRRVAYNVASQAKASA